MRWCRWVIPMLLLAAACSSASTQSVAPSLSSPASTPSATASETAAIPDELVGDWESRKGSDSVLLTIRDNGTYLVLRVPAMGIGHMTAVDGTQLDFFGGDPCADRGSYEWSIEGETLTFIPVGEDECPGRAAVLDELPYARRE